MDKKSAAVVLVAVPASVIIGTVLGIQEPLEVNGCRSSDCSVTDELTYHCVVRSVTVVECDSDVASCLLLSVDDSLGLALVNCQRLLGDHIASGFHCAADVIIMCAVNGCDDDDVRLCLGNHLLELMRQICGDLLGTQFLKTGIGIIHSCLALVTETDHAGNVRIL